MAESSSKKPLCNPFANHGVQKLLDAAEVLDAVSSSYFITNNRLQIVYCNKAFLDSQGLAEEAEIEGLRPGDVLGCYNAKHAANGCGTTVKCQACNFRNTIQDAFSSKKVIQNESMLTSADNRMLALQITATPFTLEGEEFVSISALDMTDKKRQELMESLFFHDLINLAGSLTGYIDVIQNFDTDEIKTHLPAIKQISEQILDEIVSQREIAKAEQNLLEVEVLPIDINGLLREIKSCINYHPCFKNRILFINFKDKPFTLYSDRRLIIRIIINMLKNAAEFIKKGETIKLSVQKGESDVIFSVENPGYIPEEIQNNIFQFAYSTKGKGRGFGTYGMRLLGENMLKGKVWFTSNPTTGTIFYLKLPLKLENESEI